MLLVYALPNPPSLFRNAEAIALTTEGKACLGILLFAVTLWVTEALPFAVTRSSSFCSSPRGCSPASMPAVPGSCSLIWEDA